MTWRMFLHAHWPALVAADFFTTEVWTPRGLVTYYTVFVLELRSRRVHASNSTPYPDEAFVVQAIRDLANDSVLADGCVLICDRDRKWSRGVLAFLEHEGVRIIRTRFLAPNCKAHPEKPWFETLKGKVMGLDPDWWKPMTNDEVEAFLDGR